MKIIIFTVDHLYANVVLKKLINHYGFDIKLIVVSGVILHNSSFTESLKKYLKISGKYYFLVQALKLELYKIITVLTKNKSSKFYSYKNFLTEEDTKLIKVRNVNGDFVNIVKQIKPDLIVSVLFNQILSPELIKHSKKGAINIHPAYLPDYKGVSPVFWALTNKEKYSGVSVHYINSSIDTGGIISRKKVLINKNDTEDSLYLKLVNLGTHLLIKAINDIKRGPVKTLNNSEGRYFSLPTKEAVNKFKKNGRNFFNLKEYIFK